MSSRLDKHSDVGALPTEKESVSFWLQKPIDRSWSGPVYHDEPYCSLYALCSWGVSHCDLFIYSSVHTEDDFLRRSLRTIRRGSSSRLASSLYFPVVDAVFRTNPTFSFLPGAVSLSIANFFSAKFVESVPASVRSEPQSFAQTGQSHLSYHNAGRSGDRISCGRAT